MLQSLESIHRIMTTSLLSKKRACYYCGNPSVHVHHIYYGTRHRKVSDIYGCWVYLCPRHHNMGGKSCVHENIAMDKALKIECQKAFEEKYPNIKFMDIFGKNYKEE